MDKIVADLKKLVPFKNTTAAGDIVLIAAKKPQMLVYALVTDIRRDDTKRDEWWHVTMHILSLPPRQVTWTLRTEQMAGLEIFTMDGEERFMKAVDFAGPDRIPKQDTPARRKGGGEDSKKAPLRRIK